MLDRIPDQLVDLVPLLGLDQRPDLDRVLGAPADLQRGHPIGQPGRELLGAVAGEHEVRVGVDEAGQDAGAVRVG